jgi:cell wall-associated NlpC family hydrolase
MTTACTAPARRPFVTARRAAVAALAAAGLALTPLPPASANAGGGGGGGGTVAVAAPAKAPTKAASVAIKTALAQRGKPYAWGATGPRSFDCSGLTVYSFRRAGIHLPRTSRMQATVGRPVSKAHLRPGDLVFFYRPIGHVGIYIGNGQIVHSPTRGDVVKVTKLSYMWGYTTARRVT